MNEQDYVLQQLDYHRWANRRVVEHVEGLTERVYLQPIESVFPTIYETMAHIYIIDRGWLTFLQQGGVAEMSAAYLEQLQASIASIQAEIQGLSMISLGAYMDEVCLELRSHVEQLDDIAASLPSGSVAMRIADYLQHLVHHGVYHRGNVTAMLRQLGHAGTPTDYGFYLYTLQA